MEEPDWTRRDGEVLIWQLPGEETVLQKPKKKPALKAGTGILIIVAALLTGSVFGLLMMSAVPDQKSAKQVQASGAPTEQAPSEEESAEKGTAASEKSISLFVLQGGLYSTKSAADEAAAASEERAAVLSSEKQYSMIYGVFFSKPEADQAERQLEAGGTAAYVKETKVTVSSEEEKVLKKAAEDQQLEEAASILSP
ncbi:hypothetical protein RRU94_13745 [Domibacillus sp. DTU_2020_1001157_1_SI_ALB_TIR_016]|uniref:hypothetical protein n=1 Tax=Domibacillus sp. DTU_2020_1001157_1_SI_ALB_TIR_016 TaxID=3077789 RepID=UPI0028ED8510|nr:hypothetical protein [Domibacillus sp. DTU_2020_1001157_1_SI_ALB_TIR_016]WNS81821.1 hypothetical protein RRU94_13745 [Domibacillus sp. DTU_2020_1001157_1_SI_ALB_TIR_016]